MGRKELVETLFEVEPLNKDQFLKVRETLTRIGIASRHDGAQTLWQTCHVLHKKGHYYICHFKQLFLLDGRTRVTDFTEEDEDRLEHVVALLEEWGLVRGICSPNKSQESGLTVIPFREKGQWDLRTKYTMGVRNGKKEEARSE